MIPASWPVPGVQTVQIGERGRKIHEGKKKKKGKHRILHLLIPNVEPMPYVFSVVSHPRLFMIAGVSLSNKPSDAFDF